MSITWSGNNPVVTFGDVSDVFASSGSSGQYSSIYGTGATFSINPTGFGSNIYSYNASDGSTAVALAGLKIGSLTRPNGEQLSFARQGNRLQGVSSSTGYLVKIGYASNDPNQTALYNKRVSATVVNSALDSCNVGDSGDCSGLPTARTVRYSDDGAGNLSVTDPTGQTAVYRFDSSNRLYAARLPASAQDDFTVTYGSDGRVASVARTAGDVELQLFGVGHSAYDDLDRSYGRIAGHGNRYHNRPAAQRLGRGANDQLHLRHQCALKDGNHAGRGRQPPTPTIRAVTSPSRPLRPARTAAPHSRSRPAIRSPAPLPRPATSPPRPPTHAATLRSTPITVTARCRASRALRERTGSRRRRASHTPACRWARATHSSSPRPSQSATLPQAARGPPTRRVLPTAMRAIPMRSPRRLSSRLGTGRSRQRAPTPTPADGDVKTVIGPLAGMATRAYYDADRRVVGVIGPDPDDAGPLLFRAAQTIYDGNGRVTAQQQGTATSQSDTAGTSFRRARLEQHALRRGRTRGQRVCHRRKHHGLVHQLQLRQRGPAARHHSGDAGTGRGTARR